MNQLKKSIKVLKNLQLKNGGILATPLDGAYPYVYVRDAVIMTKAFNRVDLTKNSEKFYYFIKKYSKLNQYGEIFHRYHKDGWPSVTRKKQHDNTGLVLHGIYDTYIHSGNKKFLKEMWPIVVKCVENILKFEKKGLIETGTSIHERYRLEQGYEIWCNSACIRGLYDAANMADILKHKKEQKVWYRKAKTLHGNMQKRMFNKRTSLYMKNTRFPKVSDSSQLAPFYFDLDGSITRLKHTLKHLEKHLWNRQVGGLRRFKKFEIVTDWHWYTGGSGGWVFLTAWVGRFYQKVNLMGVCDRVCLWIENVAKRSNGLLPEHVATRAEYDLWKKNEIEFNSRILSGMKQSENSNKYFKKKYKEDIVYWANPLGWSHAEYIMLKKAMENVRKDV